MNQVLEKLYKVYKSCPNIFIDNRKVNGPGIFFSIRGENHNGNAYAADALKKGASVAVVDDEVYFEDERYMLVEDSLKLLQQLARLHRNQLNIPVIAITGTNGKTTTKELINAVLSKQFKVHATKGNFNNHIGLPLTILSCSTDQELMVLEMGASKIGDINELCHIAKPTHGLITNIGKAHLEGFGRLETIFQTKKELYDFLLENQGVFFLNVNESSLSKLSSDSSLLIKFGANDELDYRMNTELKGMFANVKFEYKGVDYQCHSKLFGAYNGQNIGTAIAIGLYHNMVPEQIIEAIESYIPANNRSQIVHHNSCTYILDSYNANPSSMILAIEGFVDLDKPKKALILGDMLELGSESLSEHQKIIELVKNYDWNRVVLVGKNFGRTSNHTYECYDSIDAVNLKMEKDSWILVKGSRGISLERLLF